MHASQDRPAEGLRPVVVSAEGREWSPFAPLLLVGADQTGGSFEAYEIAQAHVEEAMPGPPPHVHREHEEAFYVLDGRFTFRLGEEDVPARAGTLVVVPRGTRHSFSMAEGARCLVFAVPGGLAGFFGELTAARAAGRADDEVRAALSERYDSYPERR